MNISTEKLNSLTSQELLETLQTSIMANTLAKKDGKMTRKQIVKVQKEIVKAIWRNYPQIAKREGLRKIKF